MFLLAQASVDLQAFADPERLTIIALLLFFLGGFKTGSWVMGREYQVERQRGDKYEAIVLRLVGVAESLLQERHSDERRRG